MWLKAQETRQNGCRLQSIGQIAIFNQLMSLEKVRWSPSSLRCLMIFWSGPKWWTKKVLVWSNTQESGPFFVKLIFPGPIMNLFLWPISIDPPIPLLPLPDEWWADSPWCSCRPPCTSRAPSNIVPSCTAPCGFPYTLWGRCRSLSHPGHIPPVEKHERVEDIVKKGYGNKSSKGKLTYKWGRIKHIFIMSSLTKRTYW